MWMYRAASCSHCSKVRGYARLFGVIKVESPLSMEKQKRRALSRWHAYFSENELGIRLSIGFVLLLAIFLFVHFREVRIDLLRVDSRAKNYVVAQVDFEFPDEAGTVVLVQQALKDVGPIYMISPRQVKQIRYDLENSLIHGDSWRSELPSVTFEEMYLGADDMQNMLMKARFTDNRTLKKMQSLHLAIEGYYVASSGDDGRVYLPDSFWNALEEKLRLKKRISNGAAEYITRFFESAEWNFINDSNAQRNIRAAIEERVPQKFSRVQAGSRIIDAGEKVTETHITKLQAMKVAIAESRNLFHPFTLLSSLLYAFIITVVGATYFRIQHPDFFLSSRRLALYATIVILSLIFAKIVEYTLFINADLFIEGVRFPIVIPFATILISVLISSEISFFTMTMLTLLTGLSLAVGHSQVIAVNFFSGMLSLFFARNLRKRKEVFAVCAKVWVMMIPIFFVFLFAQDTYWNEEVGVDLSSSFVFLFITAILVVGLLPVLESVFGVMTDITLVEYMDPNNDLLRRLSIEAPGTYQHSLVVGSIAEAAAQAIGANGLFCRVAALYHDIGKLFNPHYFTENQMGGFNIHQLLTPLESTQVIIAHVTEGAALAKKHGIPASFIDIIMQHHGTTLVYYFYRKQVEQMGGDESAVDASQFRYPGPKPKSKESVIIMVADTVEAASRSLENVNEDSIEELVNKLVDDKQREGQFDECNLSFEELQIVKRTIIKTLAVTRHIRVRYPEKK